MIRAMQRALSDARLERAASEQRVYRPEQGRALVGRVVARGLADEHRDRHYLVVDAIDGRAYYVGIGSGSDVEALPVGAVVRIVAREGVRQSDRAVAAIAAENGGRYSAVLHARRDPGASPSFIAAHERRLEGLRRGLGLSAMARAYGRSGRTTSIGLRGTRRGPGATGRWSWTCSRRCARAAVGFDGATWLDHQRRPGIHCRCAEAGFGREVRAAAALRRAWLLRQGLASEEHGEFVLEPGAIAALRRRELLRVAAGLASATPARTLSSGAKARAVQQDTVARRLDLAAGRFRP